MDEDQDHYVSADPKVDFEREDFTTEVWGHELRLTSGAGVFSRGHLDHATAILFRELEAPVQGRFLDLGCGYGPIGLRSEEHTSELQSLMRISYAVFCLKKKKKHKHKLNKHM